MSARISVTLEEAAELLGVSESTFKDHVAHLVPPADLAKPGAKSRIPRWLVKDLEAFAESRRKVA